jgi:hypothetical protein
MPHNFVIILTIYIFVIISEKKHKNISENILGRGVSSDPMWLHLVRECLTCGMLFACGTWSSLGLVLHI